MEFNDPLALDNVVYQMRQADYPRALNRARINDLFDGMPPYSEDEVDRNDIRVNVNELSGIVAAHDARSQFYNAFLTPGQFFTATTDAGPRHKRTDFGTVATREAARTMKRSLPYVECFRSKFALDVLHGIAPSGWRDSDSWCPDPFGVEDVMVPANTILTLRNLPFVCIYRSLTAPELIRLTRGPNRDPAWNMPLVNACIEWIDQQTLRLMGTNWPQIWSPEKQQQRVKSDGGFYVGDEVPTVDVWDIYFWNDENKVSGWNRRMILDAWSQPVVDGSIGSKYEPRRRTGKPYEGDFNGQFLYNPGKRKWGDQLSNIITWQFADLSAVAPFRYHSIRSLGLLLYAVCHLQNRLYSKFVEAQFEQLMMYFRVASADEMQRALRVDLVHRGFIDPSIQFIPGNERYQIRADLIQLGLSTNQNIIGRNSASYTTNPGTTEEKRELTATQWMGETNKVTALVSSALNQAYIYQLVEYREIFRRLTKKDSNDPEVRSFQARCLRHGIPEKVLYNYDSWDLEPERVMGAGNKTLEMAIADRLMAARNMFDPEPQRKILKDFTLAVTGDAARAEMLVPDQPQVTDTVFAASLAAGTLMEGMPVPVKSGINHIEYVETLLAAMATRIQQIMQRDNVGTLPELQGLQNMAQHIGQHIQIIAQDPNEKQRVKVYGDQLTQMTNLIKGFAQRLEEQMQKRAQLNGDEKSAEAAAKAQAIQMQAAQKQENTRIAHAQRTAQRQIQFEQEMKQQQTRQQMDLSTESQRQQLDLQSQAKQDLLDTQRQLRETQMEMQKQKAELRAQIQSARLDLEKERAKLEAQTTREAERHKEQLAQARRMSRANKKKKSE